jgi:hypothetical protein
MVFSKIFDHVVEGTEMHWSMDSAWGYRPGSAETALAITRRRALCELRLVARSWKSGGRWRFDLSQPSADLLLVESHSFWPVYTLILDPSKCHSSTVADLRSSRTTPSTPSYPSLFHRARSLTLGVCLPCRLNHPGRLGLYPALSKAATWSNYLGVIPTCHRHHGLYCSCCLKEASQGDNNNAGRVILSNRRGDMDDTGRYYNNPIVCNGCREGALMAHIEKELKKCARGGPIVDAGHMFMLTLTVEDYFHMGQLNVMETARLAVREQWLINQTCYANLENFMVQLQSAENTLKRRFIFRRRVESDEIRFQRILLLERLFDDITRNIPETIGRIINDIEDMYTEWSEDDELLFEDEADEDDDDNLQMCDLRPFVCHPTSLIVNEH